MLKFLREQRAALLAKLDAVVAIAERENRSLLASEQREFDRMRGEITDLGSRITAEEDRAERAAAAAAAVETPAGQARTGHSVTGYSGARFYAGADESGATYARGNGRSYVADMVRHRLGDTDATARLSTHAQEMDRRMADRDFRAAAGRVWAQDPAQEFRVNPNRTDGQGGLFVPPAWLVSEYVSLARFGRVAADLCGPRPLPPGTDTINIPALATGTAVAIQTADAAAVSSVDLTDTSVSAPVRTLAGQQDIAIQLLDQSPINFDEVVLGDLLGDYATKLDVQVLSGTGAAGQMGGILNVAGINAVTYTDATPTLPELVPPLGQAASKVATVGKAGPASGSLVHPATWNWALTQLDTTNRPLVDASTGGPFNPIGAGTPAGAMEGAVGTLLGLPVYLDGNLPTNLGVGTNETRIVTTKWDELYLWESQVRMRVMPEVLSNTLQVRLQVYAYVALIANRRPGAISVISGTGMIAPAGF
jgi:HK97 family phage major capsid protein